MPASNLINTGKIKNRSTDPLADILKEKVMLVIASDFDHFITISIYVAKSVQWPYNKAPASRVEDSGTSGGHLVTV